MDRRQIALKLVLDGLGLGVDVGSFSARLIRQKALYLAQESGIRLGYHYSWYLRGPYSSSMTRDLYAIDAEPKQEVDDLSGWTLDVTSQSKLKPLLAILEKPNEIAGDRARWLELVASIHFLLNSRKSIDANDFCALRDVLQSYNKDYSPDEAELAVQHLRRLALI